MLRAKEIHLQNTDRGLQGAGQCKKHSQVGLASVVLHLVSLASLLQVPVSLLGSIIGG